MGLKPMLRCTWCGGVEFHTGVLNSFKCANPECGIEVQVPRDLPLQIYFPYVPPKTIVDDSINGEIDRRIWWRDYNKALWGDEAR